MSSPNPVNYEFLLARAAEQARTEKPRILDYGCGYGAVVKYGLSKGYDITGVDPYEGIYAQWQTADPEIPKGALQKMEGGKIPFPDNSFDAVVSNQVFEHIEDYAPCMEEIARVLKPGAPFLARFTLQDTWYEGHAHIYGVHYLQAYPRAQEFYLRLCRTIGLGSPVKNNETPKQWAARMTRVLQTECFYHRYRDIKKDAEDIFGGDLVDLGPDYIAFRGRRLGLDKWRNPGILRPVVEALFRFIALRRAGIAMLIRKERVVDTAQKKTGTDN